MSQENVEVARKVIDAFNRGDFDAWLGFLSPEVAWESLPLVGFRDVYRGRAEAREWIEQLLEVFEEAHLEIEQMTPLNDDPSSTNSPKSGAVGVAACWGAENLGDRLVRRWPGHKASALLDQGRSPRSRRACGVGDVAGERGNRAPGLRGVLAARKLPQELFDPNWELDVTDVSPEISGVLRGLEAAEAMRPYWKTFEEFHVEIEEVIHADQNLVVDAVRDGGRIKGSEAEVWRTASSTSGPCATAKSSASSIHPDRNRALEAAGLRE